MAQDTAHTDKTPAGTRLKRSQVAQDTADTDNTHAGTPVNRSEVAQDTEHAKQHTEKAHRRTGAKWPRTPHKQSNAQSRHTGEQEPSGSGHRTRNTAHPAGTPVNRSQVAYDTAHATQHAERVHR